MTDETADDTGGDPPNGAENRPLARPSQVPANASRRTRMHSAVTSGRKLLLDGDPNSSWSRRLRDVMALHAEDIGGPDGISEAKRSLIRRAGTITVELERMEAKFSIGQAADGDFQLYQAGANSLRRILETIGLDRVARDVTPSLSDYLKELNNARENNA